MLWLIIGVMLLVAAAVVAWPQYRQEKRLTSGAVIATACVLIFSAVIYSQIGEPDASKAVGAVSSVENMVDALAQRLQSDGDDLNGWKMLGRSYSELKRYDEAIDAYEHAAELEGFGNGQTLADLGEAVMLNDGVDAENRAGAFFENALAVEPNNQKALFYGGIAAVNRGDPILAADRWETLLASSPPPEIEGILRQRIAEWRGNGSSPQSPISESAPGVELTINVALGSAANAAVDPNATVFIIARDPAQPSPPIAAVRRRASELPLAVTLGDSDSMIPGRVISKYTNLEIVVRASASGQPIAQSGDWFGDSKIDTIATRTLDIVIDQQVP